MWTLEQLEPEIDDIRGRIVQHRRGLKEYFVARDEEIDLAILCACAQEPLLLVGIPLVLLLALVVMVYGSYLATTMPIDVFPDLDRPRVVLLTAGWRARGHAGRGAWRAVRPCARCAAPRAGTG